jgi:uncharacterized membrane protein YoaK (UPF0700 family)
MKAKTTDIGLGGAAEAVVLTLIAGYVDGAGYLRIGGIYVANMSGNSVSIGLHAAKADWSGMLQKLLPVGCYVLGLILTRLMVRVGRRQHFKRVASVALTVEIALLILFAYSSGKVIGIVSAALAMGIQASTLTRFNRVTVYTAFVTGSLVKFADHLSEWLLGRAHNDPERQRSKSFRNAVWFLAVWVAYVSGAFVGALRFAKQGSPAVLWGCAGLFCILALDLCCPRELDSET